MANKGLKSYTKQLTQSVGTAGETSVNINKTDANLHITVPILETNGLSPIKVSLIFNLQDKGVNGIFGKGFRLNSYTSFSVTESKVTTTNADGSNDEYTYGSGAFSNPENNSKLYVIYPTYGTNIDTIKMEDKSNNIVEYAPSITYPRLIKMKTGETYNFDFVASTKTITNNKGDVVSFELSSGVVNKIIHRYNNTELYRVELSYTNGYISSIKHFKRSDGSSEFKEIASGLITLDNTSLLLKDNLTDYRVLYKLSGNQVDSIKDGYGELYKQGHLMSFSYSNNYTQIYDSYRSSSQYVYFDNDGFPIFER